MIEDPFKTKAKGLLDPIILTFDHSGLVETDEGKVCHIISNMTVALAADGSKFDGRIVKVEKECVSVLIGGVFECEYSGTQPGFGSVGLVADTTGKVKLGSGKNYLILTVDTGTKKVQFIKD
ncbi:hypothetical protein ACO1KB_19220 [Leptospira interrogans serovar Szwajizak]|uniref:hypothetical protein n=1 Tax=Leptospira interrogans TaxID=173 RepID=UPI00034BCDC8|nr:hypothetical protein [Leptospira interrogans]